KNNMVVSLNTEPSKFEFELLLNSTVQELNNQAKIFPEKIIQLRGSILEPYICNLMTELAEDTKFRGSIKETGPQEFPDIIAKKLYGIEVKTTTKNNWKSTGNSVLESTRKVDVKHI